MDTNTPPWTVVYQQETSTIGPNGHFVDAMAVTFKTRSGVQAKVVIPLSQYTADNVKKEIDAYVAEINQVHTLAGETAIKAT